MERKYVHRQTIIADNSTRFELIQFIEQKEKFLDVFCINQNKLYGIGRFCISNLQNQYDFQYNNRYFILYEYRPIILPPEVSENYTRKGQEIPIYVEVKDIMVFFDYCNGIHIVDYYINILLSIQKDNQTVFSIYKDGSHNKGNILQLNSVAIAQKKYSSYISEQRKFLTEFKSFSNVNDFESKLNNQFTFSYLNGDISLGIAKRNKEKIISLFSVQDINGV